LARACKAKQIIGVKSMICLKCGAKLSGEATFCPYCGTIAGSRVQMVSSQLYRAEKVIKQGQCNRIKDSTFAGSGNAVLTNHQFVYLKLGVSRTFAKIFLRNLTLGDIYIPLSEIRSIREGCKGTIKTITISTMSGEKYYFSFQNHREWENAIKDAISGIK